MGIRAAGHVTSGRFYVALPSFVEQRERERKWRDYIYIYDGRRSRSEGETGEIHYVRDYNDDENLDSDEDPDDDLDI